MKEAGATTASPWHQDGPYYNVDGPMCTIWVALDDHPRDVSLELVRGSHRWGTRYGTREFVQAGGSACQHQIRQIGAGQQQHQPDYSQQQSGEAQHWPA